MFIFFLFMILQVYYEIKFDQLVELVLFLVELGRFLGRTFLSLRLINEDLGTPQVLISVTFVVRDLHNTFSK